MPAISYHNIELVFASNARPKTLPLASCAVTGSRLHMQVPKVAKLPEGPIGSWALSIIIARLLFARHLSLFPTVR